MDLAIPTPSQLEAMKDRQGERCAVSGRPITTYNVELDHIIPLSRGGDNSLRNLHLVHEDVNRAKGSMSLEEFIALCRDVVNFAAAKQQEVECAAPQTLAQQG